MKSVTVQHLEPGPVEDFRWPKPENAAPIRSPWVGYVGNGDWFLYEHEDGSLHVYNGRGPNGGATGACVVIGRS